MAVGRQNNCAHECTDCSNILSSTGDINWRDLQLIKILLQSRNTAVLWAPFSVFPISHCTVVTYIYWPLVLTV